MTDKIIALIVLTAVSGSYHSRNIVCVLGVEGLAYTGRIGHGEQTRLDRHRLMMLYDVAVFRKRSCISMSIPADVAIDPVHFVLPTKTR